MLILAVEQSTVTGSLALLRDGRRLDDDAWPDDRRHSRQLFVRLAAMMERNGLAVSALDCLAVGLGPGSYTGLRIAVAAAQGLALPGRRLVYGVSSAEALAEDVLAREQATSVMVVGDARREQLWAHGYALRDGLCAPTTPWLLSPPARLAEVDAAIWVTSDWERIGARLQGAAPGAGRLIAENRTPSAAAVGHTAWRRIGAGIPSEPLMPIYLHAAVKPARSAGVPPAADGKAGNKGPAAATASA